MARARHVVVLALMIFAIIGLARAADDAAATAAAPADDDYLFDDDEYLIGTTDPGNQAPSPHRVVAGPIGGPVPPGAFDSLDSSPSAASSSLHHFSAVAGAATAALVGFFYF